MALPVGMGLPSFAYDIVSKWGIYQEVGNRTSGAYWRALKSQQRYNSYLPRKKVVTVFIPCGFPHRRDQFGSGDVFSLIGFKAPILQNETCPAYAASGLEEEVKFAGIVWCPRGILVRARGPKPWPWYFFLRVIDSWHQQDAGMRVALKNACRGDWSLFIDNARRFGTCISGYCQLMKCFCLLFMLWREIGKVRGSGFWVVRYYY